MKSQAFQHFPDIPLSVIGMLLFLAVFTGVLVRVLRHRAEDFSHLAALPLETEEVIHER